MHKAILIILMTAFILFVLPMIWLIDDSKADEVILFGDAEHQEIVLTLDEQELIDKVILKYKWDDVVQGTTTVRMTAHVR